MKDNLPFALLPPSHPSSSCSAGFSQVFDCELLDDPAIPARKRAELIAGLDAGAAEAARRRSSEKHAEDIEAAKAESLRRLADTVAAAQFDSASLGRHRTQADNAALAAAAARKAEALRAAQAAAGVREVEAALSDPMLREDTRSSALASNPNRFRPDHFKGLSAAQLEDIRATQQLQVREQRASNRCHLLYRAMPTLSHCLPPPTSLALVL
jgi:hypothetical protein